MDEKEDRTDILEKKIDILENMMIHLHGHLEHILEKIEFHDLRLCSLGNILSNSKLLENTTVKDIDNFFNPNIDFPFMAECYTPINEKDKEKNDKRIKKLSDIKSGSIDRLIDDI